ncbi:uncharacterized protein LOC101476357 [Maylandia zebra]|uniref:uncharacterized protein LOC101476357 n=1 Tax=Maylandia zebra TaxID=106582 RepID=UPI00403C8EF0
MDSRLVLTLLFVMLTGYFMGTYAQNITAAPNNTISVTPATSINATSTNTTSNASTPIPSSNNTTSNASTPIPSSNNTTSNASTPIPSSNNTTSNTSSTTPSSNNTTSNTSSTTPSSNNTTSNTSSTTPSSNNTTSNTSSTTPSSNNTTSNTSSTTPSSNNTTSNTTAAPTPAPLVPDSNVTILNTSFTRDNCSKTQLCVSQPSGCDPSSGTCFFLGSQALGGQNFKFSLSGQSDGYAALTLSRNTTQGVNDTTYICANDNNVLKYISALLNNGKLNPTTLKVNNVKGRINGRNIQCQFDATVPDSTNAQTKAATDSTSFSMSVSTGTYNATSGDLGSPAFQITTNVVNLSNANATVTNLVSSNSTNTTTTTTKPPTTSAANAITIQQSMMQALLITVGILTLRWL